MKRSYLLGLAALALGSAGARAQMPAVGGSEHHLLRVGVGGGASVPTSHAADALKTGVNGEGFVLVDLGFGLPALRFNLGYQRFDYKDAILNGAGSGQSSTLSGVGGLTLPLFGLGPLHPYLTAGVGAFDVKDSFSSAATGVAPSSSAVHFGVDGGGGLALKLGRLEAFVEGRVQNVYTDKGAIDAKSIQSIPVSFGILF